MPLFSIFVAHCSRVFFSYYGYGQKFEKKKKNETAIPSQLLPTYTLLTVQVVLHIQESTSSNNNLINGLSKLRAFADPYLLRKKSNFNVINNSFNIE